MLIRDGVRLPLRDGTVRLIDVPVRGQDPIDAEILLDAACEQIVDEWKARPRRAGERRRWQLKVSYEFISLVVDHGFERLLDERLAKHKRGLRGSKVSRNVFQRGLLAMFAHETEELLDEGDRNYLGPRMWYAYRHYVPPEFVNGFLSDVWTSGGEHRSATDDVEPEMFAWVVLHRARDDFPHLRGEYSRNVEEAVLGARHILEPLLDIEHRERLQRRQKRR